MPRVSFPVEELLIPQVTTPAAGSHLSVSLTPASVAAATAAYQNFTVAGLTTNVSILAMTDPLANSVALTSAKCTAANTLSLQFTNPTAGPLTPTAGTYTFLLIKTA